MVHNDRHVGIGKSRAVVTASYHSESLSYKAKATAPRKIPTSKANPPKAVDASPVKAAGVGEGVVDIVLVLLELMPVRIGPPTLAHKAYERAVVTL